MTDKLCFVVVFYNGESLLRVAVNTNHSKELEDAIQYYHEEDSMELLMKLIPNSESYGKIVEIYDIFDVVNFINFISD